MAERCLVNWWRFRLLNATYLAIAGLLGGFLGAIVSRVVKAGILPTIFTLSFLAAFASIDAMASFKLYEIPLYTSAPNWPSWLTVFVPQVAAGILAFVLTRWLLIMFITNRSSRSGYSASTGTRQGAPLS